MSKEMEIMNINGIEYVKKEYLENMPNCKLAEMVDGMPFVCVRTYSAGVHFGYLKSRNGKEVELVNSIRVYYWEGACSLSELATNGSSKIDKCKYSVTVPHIILTEAIEIIDVTEKAKLQMENAKRWKIMD